jgi:hypothetical protein
MDIHRFSAHLEAAGEYIRFAIGIAENSGEDELALRLRDLINQLHDCDPDYRAVPRSKPYQRDLKPSKPTREQTIALLQQLRAQHPGMTYVELGEELARQGHYGRSGQVYTGQRCYQLLRVGSQEQEGWSWKDVPADKSWDVISDAD